MTIYERLRKDLKESMKAETPLRSSAIRVILGEVPRLNKKVGEVVTDAELVYILKGLRKNEKMVLDAKKYKTSTYLDIVEGYLPEENLLSEDDIKEYIKTNVDLSKFHNKMKAMGPIMKELKGTVDGSLVKKVLMAIE